MPKTFCVVGHDARQQAAARVLRRAGYGVTAADNDDIAGFRFPLRRWFFRSLSGHRDVFHIHARLLHRIRHRGLHAKR